MALVVDYRQGHDPFDGDGYMAKGRCMQADSRHSAALLDGTGPVQVRPNSPHVTYGYLYLSLKFCLGSRLFSIARSVSMPYAIPCSVRCTGVSSAAYSGNKVMQALRICNLFLTN